MAEIMGSVPFLLLALLCVTLIATVGAIASRMLRFNYGYLTVLSLTVYTSTGFMIAAGAGFTVVLMASLLVSCYDATIGWKLATMCRANFVLEEEELKKIDYTHNLKLMLLIGPAFFTIGYLIADAVN